MEDLHHYYDLTEHAFRALAPFYDVVTLPLSGVREDVVAFSGAASGDEVLDVATGTGAQALAFARHGHPVVGIDITDAMLDVARRKNRFPNARFLHADATRLPFEDGRFPVVTISYALHDMPESVRPRVLREMARVARPGGTLVVVDYGSPANPAWRRMLHALIGVYEGEYFGSFVATDLRALLAAANIEVVEEKQALLGYTRMVRGRVREPGTESA